MTKQSLFLFLIIAGILFYWVGPFWDSSPQLPILTQKEGGHYDSAQIPGRKDKTPNRKTYTKATPDNRNTPKMESSSSPTQRKNKTIYQTLNKITKEEVASPSQPLPLLISKEKTPLPPYNQKRYLRLIIGCIEIKKKLHPLDREECEQILSPKSF